MNETRDSNKQESGFQAIHRFKDSPDPLLRATYWFTDFSWGGHPDVPDPFDMLQQLAREVQQQARVRDELLEVLEALLEYERATYYGIAEYGDETDEAEVVYNKARATVAKAKRESDG